MLDGPEAPDAVFRSALCFWEDEGERGGLASRRGHGRSRNISPSRRTAASSSRSSRSRRARASNMPPSSTSGATGSRNLGRLFLEKMAARGRRCAERRRGARSSSAARSNMPAAGPTRRSPGQRYDLMFGGSGPRSIMSTSRSARRSAMRRASTDPATILVADFGGGTSDFSVVRIEAPGAARRCMPLGHAGVGIAGDRFDSASSIISSCRCSARAAPIARSTRSSRSPAAISPISPTGRGWR
jgi:hypothetical chaperone protein